MKSELIDRRKMKRQMTGHTVLLLAFFAFAFAFSGCEREELFEILPEDEGFPIVGEYVNAQLILNVGDTYVNTKSEDPDLENPEHNTDAEKAVDGFWVFQYDATSGEIVNGSPKYLTDLGPTAMTYIIETENVLTTNNGNKSIVYVVANVGSSSNWISSDSYATLDGLFFV